VVVGRPWPERPALVRVRSTDEAKEAAEAGADGVIADASLGTEALQDLAETVHAHSVRLFVSGGARALELAAADGVVDQPLPPELKERFPEALSLKVDAAASQALDTPAAFDRLRNASGPVETHGLVQAAFAHLSPDGLIVDHAAFPLLGARKRHPALSAAAEVELYAAPPQAPGWAFAMRAHGDETLLMINGSACAWRWRPPGLAAPLDLLGSHVENDTVELKPGDVALLVRSPAPDKTRF
jgi:hypothetical protein